jgi:hypothetical protein
MTSMTAGLGVGGNRQQGVMTMNVWFSRPGRHSLAQRRIQRAAEFEVLPVPSEKRRSAPGVLDGSQTAYSVCEAQEVSEPD